VCSILDGWPAIPAATGKLPARVGNRHLATAPYDCFRARDGWVVIAVATNRIFRRLAEAIGRPELGSDPRFRGSSGRLERSAEINELVGAWVAGHSVEEVTDALGPARANVPCAPVYGVAESLPVMSTSRFLRSRISASIFSFRSRSAGAPFMPAPQRIQATKKPKPNVTASTTSRPVHCQTASWTFCFASSSSVAAIGYPPLGLVGAP